MDGIATIFCGHALIRCNRPELKVAPSLFNLRTSSSSVTCQTVEQFAIHKAPRLVSEMITLFPYTYILPPEVASPRIVPFHWKTTVTSRPHGRPK
jgi:hypothetical protein